MVKLDRLSYQKGQADISIQGTGVGAVQADQVVGERGSIEGCPNP